MYYLSSVLQGHSGDVRGVSSINETKILTCSRDFTAKLWEFCGELENGDRNFVPVQTFTSHTSFVASIAYLPPCDSHPKGVIVTAGHDRLLNGYEVDDASGAPIFVCIGHTDTVCCIAAGNAGVFVSGSWDKTCRVWSSGKCLAVLKGHEMAVWAILVFPNDDIVTGSADKTLKLWRKEECIFTLNAHTDCVRGLALLDERGFVSCGNDGMIHLWDFNYEKLGELHGHTSFVYSVDVLPNRLILSGGEDRCVKIWDDKLICIQTIAFPCASVWSVHGLRNLDFVVGTSDGVARIFSSESARRACSQTLKHFEDSVASFGINSQSLGGLDKNQLKTEKALLQPGRSDGQTIMIRNQAGIVEAHQWSSSLGSWTKIGDVMDAVGSSTKQLLNGIEYDYVFDVDIGDGMPHRKLGYNASENPFMAAQRFIDQNDLDQDFLNQISDFITKNASPVTLDSSSSIQNEFVDPFTGSGRYISSAVSSTHSKNENAKLEDSASGPSEALVGGKSSSSDLSKKYIFFTGAKYDLMAAKFIEFHGKVQVKLSQHELDAIVNLIQELPKSVDPLERIHFDILLQILKTWDPEFLFPVLDLLRNIFLLPSCCRFFRTSLTYEVVDIVKLLSHISRLDNPLESSPHTLVNRTLVWKIFCNCFNSTFGCELVYSCASLILSNLKSCMKASLKPSYSQAFASLLVNFSVYSVESKQATISHDLTTDLISLSLLGLGFVEDSEAQYRLLLAIQIMVSNSTKAKEIASLQSAQTIVEPFKTLGGKLSDCASGIIF